MYDIIFISYYESNAEKNFSVLSKKFQSNGVFGHQRVKHVKNVKGIHNAHKQAAELSTTSYFFVVDADAVIVDDFDFTFKVQPWNKDTVYVWKSKNPINGLIYGYGGVKLLPTMITRNISTDTIDMTTSISKNFEVVDEISNITEFNTDPFSTWKSAFRECAKLSSKSIDRQIIGETNERLKTWTTVGHDRPFGEHALAGAAAGMEFGLSDSVDLTLINDFDWLKCQFYK